MIYSMVALLQMWSLITSALAANALSVSNEIVLYKDTRIQALSPTLVRIEPIGLQGFEDRTTFMVTNRSAFSSGEALQLHIAR